MLDNFKKEKSKEKEHIISARVRFSMVNGVMMKKLKDSSYFLMAIFFKVVFTTICVTKEFISIKMAIFIMENGKMM